jgi:tetratricopeptide (TPR) repeat protein
VNDERLEELLAQFWARRDAGEPVTPSTFAAEHPAAAERLRAALDAMLATSGLLPDAGLPANIGRWQVRSRLGRGATGEVFVVADEHGAPFALKRLLPHAAALARANERLHREAHVLRGLRHGNVVAIVDVGDDPASGAPFVVMEFVAGGTLAAWLDRARREGRERAAAALPGPGDSWQRIARFVGALADGLAAAHAAGVLHRDLKPGNVLLRADGSPVVVDFGLAADAAAATLTATGEVLGTPAYMAPEQARGEHATAASDVYGLGAILFEMLTLRPPRTGDDPLQVLTDARHRLPPTPRMVDRTVPRELDLITRAAMAFRPRHRPRDAAALARALELVAAGGRPIGLTLGWSQQAVEFVQRRRLPLLGIAAAAVLALAAWIGLDWYRSARAEDLRLARVAAAECHVDGDAGGLAAAAATLAENGERALAAWLTGAGPDDDDAFVAHLRAGAAALPRDAKAAEAQFAAAAAMAPEASIAIAWRAIAAAAAGTTDVAERELLSAIRLLPGSVRLRIDLGRLLRQQRRSAEAITVLTDAVGLPRASATAWHELANAYSVAHDYDQGLVAIERAITLAGPPTPLAMIRTKASILNGRREHEAALPLFRQVVDADPGPNAWVNYGAVLDSLHRLDEASDAYRQAVRLDPRHASALSALVYLHTGSDVDCARCKAWFAAHPQALDPAFAESSAIAMLDARDSLRRLEAVAGYLLRARAGERFVAAIDERLRQDLPAATLGLLLRARKVLRPD